MSAPLHDCLIVLDTLGTRSSAAILGIVAVRFDLDDASTPCEELDLAVSADSNRDENRTYDAATLAWWAERPDMFDVFSREGGGLGSSLRQLADFYAGSINIWTTQGFETNVLSHAYEALKIETPWPYWAATCARTTGNIGAWLRAAQAEPGTYGNNALETAHLRVAALRRAYATIQERAVPYAHTHTG